MSANDPKRTSKAPQRHDRRGRAALVSVSLQSLVDIAEQVVVIVWLAQEGNRTGLHGACPRGIVRIASDENNGDAMTSGDQPVLQVNAA